MVSRFISAVALTGLLAAPAASDEVKSPTLIYSPWIKFCLGETCFIGKDGRSDCDPVVAAVLIERKGETKKTLRVTLPTPVNVERGVRIIVDQDQPIDRPYAHCFPMTTPTGGSTGQGSSPTRTSWKALPRSSGRLS
jgi:invasion protein IalB